MTLARRRRGSLGYDFQSQVGKVNKGQYYKKSIASSAGIARHRKAEKATTLRRAKTVKTASVVKVVKRKRRG